MDHGYEGIPRFDNEGDVVMWNTRIPYMPAEIIEHIASFCDRPTLKALRLTNRLSEFATRPTFHTLLRKLILEINLKDQTPSAQNLQAIARDEVKRKLVHKVVVTVKSDLMFSEDRSWQMQLGPIKGQKQLNSHAIKYLSWLFQRLCNCWHLEITAPKRVEGKKRSSFTESRVFGYAVWPIIIAALSSPSIHHISHSRSSALDMVLLSQPGGALYPSNWSVDLTHLTQLDLNIGTCANDRVWSPPDIWRRLFSTMTNLEKLTLNIHPLLKRYEEGWQADWRSSNEIFKALDARQGKMRELRQLVLRADGVYDVSDLCACISTFYTRIEGIGLMVGVAKPTELYKVVHMLDSLRLQETPLVAF